MGKWMNAILENRDEENHRGCVNDPATDLETLGRLAEGNVTSQERTDLIRHLDQCPRCYEVFEDLLDLMAEEEAEAETDFEDVATEPSRPPRRQFFAIAASVLLAVFLGGGLYSLFGPGVPGGQPRIARVEMTPKLEDLLAQGSQLVLTGRRAAEVAAALAEAGVRLGDVSEIRLATPYMKSKSLFAREPETLQVRIEGDTVYLEVRKNRPSEK